MARNLTTDDIVYTADRTVVTELLATDDVIIYDRVNNILKKISKSDMQEALGVNEKSDKSNVLEKDNVIPYTPILDYHPATRKFVLDNSNVGNVNWGSIFGDINNQSDLNNTFAKIDQEDWIEPTLLNGWSVASPDFTVKFRKDNFENLWFKGRLSTGLINTIAFILPVGYRPTTFVGITGMTALGTFGRINISPTGEFKILSYDSYIYLDDIQIAVGV